MNIKVRVSARGVREMAVVDEPWRDEFADRFRAESCTGLLLGCPTAAGCMPDIDFVVGLDGLRSIRLLLGVGDVSAAFRHAELEQLALPGRFKGALALDSLPALRVLETPHVKGLETVSGLRALEELTVVGWTAPDHRLLGVKPHLRYLRIEQKRGRTLSCAGVDAMPGLERLNYYEGRLTDLPLLGALHHLREIAFRNTKIADLGFVRDLPELASLELDNCGEVESLEPLRGSPALESVAISGSTVVRDGDLSPLLDVPRLRAIGVARGAPNYSHTPAEIRRLVAARR